ncbi:response regulator transcription factor [Janthinobacterium agaricidamnosum]|uniref:Response regulator n=1 Tax=Janthinobacterium agaricidamnosum NBRC 102515 = DSM 9628 TaxID=1349767 RepID=W0V6D1_9BURK|nr:response regulator [Janthinobacterium agaricidamnosum]CDG83160.1 response regulator [Janthinobacterium agaricidamnosum NBRC 102515 = DSM 9628]
MRTRQHLLYTIAIVDDNHDVREALLGLLRSYGHVALVFDSAAALLASPALEHCACIVSDVQMPDMNGLEMQAALQAAGRDTPLVFFTAFPDPAIRQRALDAGATCFLNKPFDVRALIACIGKAMDRQASCGKQA